MDDSVIVFVLAGCIIAIGTIWVAFKRFGARADAHTPEQVGKS